jgi:hypothetical protein
MGEIKRYDRIEPHEAVDGLEAAMQAVDVVHHPRWSGGPKLVVLPHAAALDVGSAWGRWCPWGRADLSYRARVEPGGARVEWRNRNRTVARTAWIWEAGGWCDERLMHYGWAGLAEQVAHTDALIWTCVNWREACGDKVRVEARDRLGWADAVLEIWPLREPTRWEPRLRVGMAHHDPSESVASLEDGMRLFAPLLAAPQFGALRPTEAEVSEYSNRPQRALQIWEGSHLLYHSPTHGAPLEEIWADDFERMLLEWWRGDGAREYYKER